MTETTEQKIEAVGHQAYAVANLLSRKLNLLTEYRGPVVTAGGYWRDKLFDKPSKDLDIFLRSEPGQYTMGHMEFMAHCAATALGVPVFSLRNIPCYGEWADDMNWLVKVDPGDRHYPELDFIFLNGDIYPADNFLGSCLNRFDVRLNSIGASAAQWAANHALVMDIQAKRLVAHYERLPMNERMQKRMAYLRTDAKFPGWTTWVEEDDQGNSIKPYDSDDDASGVLSDG